MQTLKHNQDAMLIVWPATPQEWEQNPVINFTVATGTEVKKGDRLYTTTKMLTAGPNSGGIVNIYYYLQEIQEIVPVPEENISVITATAKRVEI